MSGDNFPEVRRDFCHSKIRARCGAHPNSCGHGTGFLSTRQICQAWCWTQIHLLPIWRM